MNIYLLALNTLELSAFVIGVVMYKKLNPLYKRYFVLLLGFIILSEGVGKYLRYLELPTLKTYWYSYVSIPIQFISYYWLFSKRTNSRNSFFIPTTFFILSFPIDYFLFRSEEFSFSSLSYVVGNFMLLLVVFHYLFYLMKSDEILHFSSDLFFWISIGILIFYLPTLPYYGLLNYLMKLPPELFGKFNVFGLILNCTMYTLFCIGLLWRKNR